MLVKQAAELPAAHWAGSPALAAPETAASRHTPEPTSRVRCGRPGPTPPSSEGVETLHLTPVVGMQPHPSRIAKQGLQRRLPSIPRPNAREALQCQACWGASACVHGRRKSRCKDCVCSSVLSSVSPSAQGASAPASAGGTDRDLAGTQFSRNCVPYNIIEF